MKDKDRTGKIRSKGKTFGKIVVFLLIFVLLLTFVQELLLKKGNHFVKMQHYNELEKDSLDILFMGNSHIMGGIDPAVINEKTGGRSFNCGVAGLRMPHVVALTEESLKTQTPKLIVVDTVLLAENDKEGVEEVRAHRTFDQAKFGLSKIKAVHELMPGREAEFLFPIIKYHTRYNELTQTDFDWVYNKSAVIKSGFNGFGASKEAMKDAKDGFFDTDFTKVKESEKPEERIIKSIEQLIELSEREHAQLLFITVPFKGKKQDIEAQQVVKINNYVREHYVDGTQVALFDMNLYYKEMELGYADFHNPGHLNKNGAAKVSGYLADYLLSEYTFLKKSKETRGT